MTFSPDEKTLLLLAAEALRVGNHTAHVAGLLADALLAERERRSP